jgi:prepilin-type N-terminal cleavage/methylation domain-containing protein
MGKIYNFKFKILNSQKGFTLIEAVVATAVFAFVISAVIGVYLSVLKLDRKSRSQRAVYDNSRFIMEFFAKEIRNGSIEYSVYGGSIPSNPDLYLRNQANEVEHFFLNGTNLILNKNGTDTNMNSAGVRVTKLKFFIAPTTDPYTPAKAANEQPHVTVVLELTSNYGVNTQDQAKINIQDTFAMRIYPARE